MTRKMSFLTVVLNNLSGLERTIASVLEQDCQDWEMIIKDGGSTDGTVEYAEKFAAQDPRIRLVQTDDIGIYDAMNQALAAANEEFCVFLNSGDTLVEPTTLSRFFELIADKPADIYFAHSIFDIEESFRRRRPAKPAHYIRYGQPAIHQSTIFRTSLHQQHPYTADYKVSSDYATTAEMMVAGARTENLDMDFSYFEVIAESTSFKLQALSRKEMARAQREILKLGEIEIAFHYTRRYLTNKIMQLLQKYAKAR